MLNMMDLPRNKDPAQLHAISVDLAAGKMVARVWREEIYGEGVTKPLCPLGRAVKRLKLKVNWTEEYCTLDCCESADSTNFCPLMSLILKRDMPYFTKKQFNLIRRALWDHLAGRRIFDKAYWTQLILHPRAQPDMYQSAAMECHDAEVD